MAKYIYDRKKGCLVDKETGVPSFDGSAPPVVPMIFHDIGGYTSPIDGSWIEGKRAERYHMEKNDVVHTADISKPKKLRNERFIKKHGLHHLSE